MPEMLTVTRHGDVCAILADCRFVVPPAEPGGRPGTLAWLQSSVSRFCSGPDHDRRRATVVAALHGMSPASLHDAARKRALAVLAPASGGALDVMARLARPVPIAVLGSALGVAEDDLSVLVECVSVVAAAYFPGISAEQRARADSAVARLVHLLGVDPDEATASRIGLLVQACEATAGLTANALRLALQLPPSCAEGWPVEALVTETLRYDSPIRNTRRHALPGVALNGRPLDAGTAVLLDLDAANRDPAVFDDPHRFDPGRRAGSHLSFGYGLRPCPGAGHALALASGVIEAVLPQAALARADIPHQPYPNLRVPTRLEVVIR